MSTIRCFSFSLFSLFICCLISAAVNDVSLDSLSIHWLLTNTTIDFWKWGICEMYNNKVYLMSHGYCPSGDCCQDCYYSEKMYSYDLITKAYTELSATIPTNFGFLFEEASKLKINNYLYFIPYECYGCYHSVEWQFYRLELDSLTFTALAPKLDAIPGSALCYDKYNNTIYSVGGCCQKNTVLTYSIADDEWQYFPHSLNVKRAGAYCIEYNYKLITLVGNGYWKYDSDDSKPEILDLRHIENGWNSGQTEIGVYVSHPYVVELLPYPIILMMAGSDLYKGNQNTIILYNMETEEVKLLNDSKYLLPFVPIYGCVTYDYIHGILYNIGGEDGDFDQRNEIWKSLLTFNNNTLSPFTTTSSTSMINSATIAAIATTTTRTQTTKYVKDGDSNTNSGDDIGMIISIIFGILFVVGLVVFGFVYHKKRQKADSNTAAVTKQNLVKQIEITDQTDKELKKEKKEDHKQKIMDDNPKNDNDIVDDHKEHKSGQRFTIQLANGQTVEAKIISSTVNVKDINAILHQESKDQDEELYGQIEGNQISSATTAHLDGLDAGADV